MFDKLKLKIGKYFLKKTISEYGKGVNMINLKAILKSKTFWGGLAFALLQFLETQGIVANELYALLSSMAAGLGLYGARNTKKKGG